MRNLKAIIDSYVGIIDKTLIIITAVFPINTLFLLPNLEPYKPPKNAPIEIPKRGTAFNIFSKYEFEKGVTSINYKSLNAIPLAFKAEPKGITVNPQQIEIVIMYTHLTLAPSSAVA